MEACLFLIGRSGPAPAIDMRALLDAAATLDGLTRLVVHERIDVRDADPLAPTPEDHPFSVQQWYFDDLDRLEAAIAKDGAIEKHLPARAFSAQQALAVRHYPVTHAAPAAQVRCTYLVSYEGIAEDFDAWLTHYVSGHPPLMVQLPGIRELEIYTRLDYRSALSLPKHDAIQRNKVVFDDMPALTAALSSPIREAMRRDFHALPAFEGRVPHYPMRSIYLR